MKEEERNDEIVDEVRKARDEFAAKFNYDISALCAEVRKKQAESGRKIVFSIEQEESKKPDVPKAA